MEFEKIVKLIDVVAASGLAEFELEENGSRLYMGTAAASEKKHSGGERNRERNKTAGEYTAQTNGSFDTSEENETEAEQTEKTTGSVKKTQASGEPGVQTALEGETVRAPLVGTFYSAPSEGEEPFVKAGDRVTKGQVLGIIEAMKLMNEIESEYDGVVEAVLVKNEQVVEYGQPLFSVKAD